MCPAKPLFHWHVVGIRMPMGVDLQRFNAKRLPMMRRQSHTRLEETVVPNTGSEYSSVGIAGLRFLSIRVHVMPKEVNNVTWRKPEYRNVCCRGRDMVTAYMVMRCAHWTFDPSTYSQYHACWKTSFKHGGRLACLLSVLSTCWKHIETYRYLYVNWYPYLILFSDSESTMM
jgi:hypothetical protein